MKRAAVLQSLDIRPRDFVVEIGAGTLPFSRTGLILDKHPFDDAERAGPIRNVAPIVRADAERIPLKRGSCDVLFMSHVLEHLPHPERFAAEAARCADRVYLEFPSARRELMYAWSFHRWLVELREGTLVLYRNDVPQQFGDFFHANYDLLFHLWSEERHEQLNAWWFGRAAELRVEIAAESALQHVLASSAADAAKRGFPSAYADSGEGNVAYSLADRAKLALWSITPPGVIRRRRRRQLARERDPGPPAELDETILARLLCNACRDESARLERRGAELVCSGCGQRFSADRGVFDLDLPPASG